jgi:hypothetical protein
MINNFVFDEQFYRTIPASIIDGRGINPAVAGQIGSVIKEFCDTEVNKARAPGVLTYKLETINGNLIGAMTLQVVNGVAGLYQLWIRQAFQVNLSVIQAEISNFITGLTWNYDLLI